MNNQTPEIVPSSRCTRVQADNLPTADIEIAEYPFRGNGGCQCICSLRIWYFPARTIVIVTELPHNPGTSITNAADVLWRKLTQEFRLSTSSIVWQIEHYPAEPGNTIAVCQKHRYSLVTFPGGAAEWMHLTSAFMNLLFGEKTEVA